MESLLGSFRQESRKLVLSLVLGACVTPCFRGSVYWYKFLAQFLQSEPTSLLCVLTWAAKSGSVLKLSLHFPQICGFEIS